jgi:acyl carrier protein
MPEQTEAELAAKVIGVIAKAQRIPPETITLDSTFEELKIDSLDGINIVFALENEFQIEIPDEGAQNLRSVRETVEGVATLLAAKPEIAAATTAGVTGETQA